jgi:pteridine reductase
MINLAGKTALVTGGGKRIGKEISLALAREGVNLVIHYPVAPGETDEVTSRLAGQKIKFWTLRADFTKPAEYGMLVKRALELAGGLDILVNNASVFSADTPEEATLENLTRDIEINAWAPFVLIRDFACHGRGSVVNILDSKVSGQDMEHTSYILSKRLLMALSEMSALRYAPGITVNAVAPGLILPPAGKDETYLDKLSGGIPLRRHGWPQDIASAVVYLLRNDYITGQVLYVDGGRALSPGGV